MKLMTMMIIESKTAQFLSFRDLFTDLLNSLMLNNTLSDVYLVLDTLQLSEVSYFSLL